MVHAFPVSSDANKIRGQAIRSVIDVIDIEIPGACAEIWSDIAGGSEAILGACGVHSGAVVVRTGAQSAVAELEASWADDTVQPRAS